MAAFCQLCLIINEDTIQYNTYIHTHTTWLVHTYINTNMHICIHNFTHIHIYARLLGALSKFSSITAYMRDVLHWLPISERIQYHITAMVSRCVLGCAPSYLRDLCCPVSVWAARRVLRSAARGEFLVPRARLAIMQRRAFSVVGPSAWDELPFELRSFMMAHPSKFYIALKSFFFVRDWAGSAS